MQHFKIEEKNTNGAYFYKTKIWERYIYTNFIFVTWMRKKPTFLPRSILECYYFTVYSSCNSQYTTKENEICRTRFGIWNQYISSDFFPLKVAFQRRLRGAGRGHFLTNISRKSAVNNTNKKKVSIPLVPLKKWVQQQLGRGADTISIFIGKREYHFTLTGRDDRPRTPPTSSRHH